MVIKDNGRTGRYSGHSWRKRFLPRNRCRVFGQVKTFYNNNIMQSALSVVRYNECKHNTIKTPADDGLFYVHITIF